jgi:predicted peptidase
MSFKAKWVPYVLSILLFLFLMILVVHDANKVYMFSADKLELRFGESEAGTFEATVFDENSDNSYRLEVKKGNKSDRYDLKPNIYQTFGFNYGSGDYEITLYRKGDKSSIGKVTVNVDASGIKPYAGTNTQADAKPTKKPSTTNTSYDAVWELRSYTHPEGKKINYWINVPEGATSGMPIVLFLHGDGEMGSSKAVKNLKPVQFMHESKDYISLAPVGVNSDWTSNKIQQTLKGLLDKYISEYEIDTSRVYIWGFSRGAIGTWGMVERYGSFFTAAVPISCGSNSGSSIKTDNFMNTKVFALAGSKESGYIRSMQAIVNKIVDAGGTAKFETVAGQSHHSITANFPYSEVINDWLLKQ